MMCRNRLMEARQLLLATPMSFLKKMLRRELHVQLQDSTVQMKMQIFHKNMYINSIMMSLKAISKFLKNQKLERSCLN